MSVCTKKRKSLCSNQSPALIEGKKKRGGPKGIKKKDTAGSGGKVTIMRMSRNKRKSITVITGLDTYRGEGEKGGERRRDM